MPGSRTPRRAVDRDGERVVGELLTASRLLVAIAARSLAAVEESLTLPQYRMPVVLDARGPVSLARMAELLDVNPRRRASSRWRAPAATNIPMPRRFSSSPSENVYGTVYKYFCYRTKSATLKVQE